MRNPFRILKLIFQWHRPRSITNMTAVADGFWLRRGYTAMTFFGHIVTPTQKEADLINRDYNTIRNHEMIHLRQAQSTHNSWLCFYARYLWYWLRALPLNRKMKNAAYRLNPFEIEAYEHENDLHYLDNCTRKGINGWREHARKKPRQRLEEYKSRGRF